MNGSLIMAIMLIICWSSKTCRLSHLIKSNMFFQKTTHVSHRKIISIFLFPFNSVKPGVQRWAWATFHPPGKSAFSAHLKESTPSTCERLSNIMMEPIFNSPPARWVRGTTKHQSPSKKPRCARALMCVHVCVCVWRLFLACQSAAGDSPKLSLCGFSSFSTRDFVDFVLGFR